MIKAVTIADMARELRVSTATVAKALHGQGRISKAMVQRVRALANEWKYIPNTSAKSLRKQEQDTVGLLIIQGIVNPWYGQLASHLADHFASLGRMLLLALGRGDDVRIQRALGSFLGGRVCGMLTGPVLNQTGLEELRPVLERQIPLVVFSNLESLPVNYVSLEQEKGAYLLLEHLHGLGHRRIAFLGCQTEEAARVAGTRAHGYTVFMEKNLLQPEYLTLAELTRHDAYNFTRRLVAERPREALPTALMCHNDDLALGALLALQQAGIRVPQEVSVTGFDDIEEAGFCLPGLTTIGGILEKMASELVAALEHALHHPPEELYQSFVKPQLILRETTAAPRDGKAFS